jgi:small subunit ribosomal protein S20
VKKANASIEAKAETAPEAVKSACVVLERAGGKGLIHRNTASRKVSRMMKRANAQAAAK